MTQTPGSKNEHNTKNTIHSKNNRWQFSIKQTVFPTRNWPVLIKTPNWERRMLFGHHVAKYHSNIHYNCLRSALVVVFAVVYRKKNHKFITLVVCHSKRNEILENETKRSNKKNEEISFKMLHHRFDLGQRRGEGSRCFSTQHKNPLFTKDRKKRNVFYVARQTNSWSFIFDKWRATGWFSFE